LSASLPCLSAAMTLPCCFVSSMLDSCTWHKRGGSSGRVHQRYTVCIAYIQAMREETLHGVQQTFGFRIWNQEAAACECCPPLQEPQTQQHVLHKIAQRPNPNRFSLLQCTWLDTLLTTHTLNCNALTPHEILLQTFECFYLLPCNSMHLAGCATDDTCPNCNP
jgi:hypothetical protein